MQVGAQTLHFQCVVRVLSSAMGLHCQYVQSNQMPCQQVGLFGDFHGITKFLLSITQFDTTHLQYWKLQLVMRWPIGIPSFPLFGDLISITFINFRKFPIHFVSISPFKCLSLLAVLCLIPFTNSFLLSYSFPSHPHIPIPLVLFPPIRPILFSPPREIHVSHIVSSSILSLQCIQIVAWLSIILLLISAQKQNIYFSF